MKKNWIQLSEPILFFTLGLFVSSVIYVLGKKASAPETVLTEGDGSRLLGKGLTRRVTDQLPGLQKKKEYSLDSSVPVQVKLQWTSDWEWNAQAPSWMALFESNVKGSAWSQSLEVDQKNLSQGGFSLPALSPEKKYLIQGTVYLCKKVDHSVCTIRSYSDEIAVHTGLGSSLKEIEL